MQPEAYYLHYSILDRAWHHEDGYLCKVEGKDLAERLVSLLSRQFHKDVRLGLDVDFAAKPVESFDPDQRILIEEQIADIQTYTTQIGERLGEGSLPPVPTYIVAIRRWTTKLSAEGASAPRAEGAASSGPSSASAPAQEGEPVVLRGRDAPPLVMEKPKPTISDTQYDVVEALLRAPDRRLSMKELGDESGHDDARKALKRLADSDPDWKAVIHFPGKAGRKYRIGWPDAHKSP